MRGEDSGAGREPTSRTTGDLAARFDRLVSGNLLEAEVLGAGYVCGADCWHLATALYLAGDRPGELSFVTLDHQQRAVAAELGFGE